jgi:hypothetical protein
LAAPNYWPASAWSHAMTVELNGCDEHFFSGPMDRDLNGYTIYNEIDPININRSR